MTAARTKKPRRRFLRLALLVVVVLLAIPPLQVASTWLWNPTWSPMQAQRHIEAWRKGEEYTSHPIRWVPLDEIPRPLIHYIWASEDQRFFRHGGFDLGEMRKAVADAKKKGRPVRGSSTITMQCARSVFLWQGRSYLRKTLEAYYTFWMEVLLSKRRILELYLNHIEFGPGIYGVGTAAREHFGRSPDRLTDRQMIALAAILPNPRKWSPVKPDATVLKKIRRIERLSSRAPFPRDALD